MMATRLPPAVSPSPVSAPAACRSLIPFRMSSSELACVYASLILHDDGLDITVNCTSLAAFQCVYAWWDDLIAKTGWPNCATCYYDGSHTMMSLTAAGASSRWWTLLR